VFARLGVAKHRSIDFAKLLEEATAGDSVYLDPPFTVSKRRVLNEYQPEMFSAPDARFRESITTKGFGMPGFSMGRFPVPLQRN